MLFPRRIGEQIYFIGHGQTVFIPASGKESVFHSLHNKVNAKIGEVFSMNSIKMRMKMTKTSCPYYNVKLS